jgi:hypothetical protein
VELRVNAIADLQFTDPCHHTPGARYLFFRLFHFFRIARGSSTGPVQPGNRQESPRRNSLDLNGIICCVTDPCRHLAGCPVFGLFRFLRAATHRIAVGCGTWWEFDANPRECICASCWRRLMLGTSKADDRRCDGFSTKMAAPLK